LLAAGYGATRPMASVGYREVAQVLSTGLDIDVRLLSDDIARATRIFARRQLTWLREQPVTWLHFADPAATEGALNDVRAWLRTD
jgi:tRNA dimethylallyltransferase